jgi:hypothetical protein
VTTRHRTENRDHTEPEQDPKGAVQSGERDIGLPHSPPAEMSVQDERFDHE